MELRDNAVGILRQKLGRAVKEADNVLRQASHDGLKIQGFPTAYVKVERE